MEVREWGMECGGECRRKSGNLQQYTPQISNISVPLCLRGKPFSSII